MEVNVLSSAIRNQRLLSRNKSLIRLYRMALRGRASLAGRNDLRVFFVRANNRLSHFDVQLYRYVCPVELESCGLLKLAVRPDFFWIDLRYRPQFSVVRSGWTLGSVPLRLTEERRDGNRLLEGFHDRQQGFSHNRPFEGATHA